MAKVYATFSVSTDGEWSLADGPDGDYAKHRSNIMEARTKGTGKNSKIVMCDLKASVIKTAAAHNKDREKTKAARADYREAISSPKSTPASKPAKKTAKGKGPE